MEIIEAVLHRISKERQTSGPGSTTVTARPNASPVDAVLSRMAEDLRKIYTSSAQGYGIFNADENVYPFPRLLREHREGAKSFVELTQNTLSLIAAKMADEHFATGGYVLFLRYDDVGHEWMMIAMLKLRPGTSVNDETLELMETVSLDLDHLHEAARVDLTKWQENQQPYLSFIKKRAGQDVSSYFRGALGCTDYTDSKHHTEKIKKALEDFFVERQWTREQKQVAKKTFVELCEAHVQAGDPVNLDALSAVIDTQEPASFATFVREGDYPVSNVFQPAKSVYSKWRRIVRSFGSVKVAFEVQDVTSGTVDYDEDNGYMVIRNPPQDLVDQIRESRAAGDDPA
jgi:nucleoid-associated protein